MMIFILITPGILLSIVLKIIRKEGWRYSIVSSAVISGSYLAVITELLSIKNLLAFYPIVLAWVMYAIVLIIYLCEKSIRKKIKKEIKIDIENITSTSWALIFYIILVISLTAIFAWYSPPNTYDSMTYHMSRVMHWMQNESIEFYPTSILRQLHSNPFAEYVILTLQILTNSDKYANYVQWICMVFSLITASLIAKELGASKLGQLLSAAVCAGIPMGILQSTSTQNDYVVSFFSIAFVYYGILLVKNNEKQNYVMAGIALGLAILSKATAYIVLFPFCVMIGYRLFFTKWNKTKTIWILILISTVIGLNIGHLSRNYDAYESPIGPTSEGGGYKYSNDEMSVKITISNAVRNIGIHLEFIVEKYNRYTYQVIEKIHDYLNILLNDPRSTWPETKFEVQGRTMDEDVAGNLIQIVLMTLTILIYFVGVKKKKDINNYLLTILIGFVLFNMYLRWQPWNSRLQLPFFVMMSPFIGYVLGSVIYKIPKITKYVVVLIFGMTVQPLFASTSKPITGANNIFVTERESQYFRKNPDLFLSYKLIAKEISENKCEKLGLIINGNDWEYPIWILLKNQLSFPFTLRHVNVNNISSKYIKELEQNLCGLIVIEENQKEKITVNKNEYRNVKRDKNVSYYSKTN